MTDHPQRPVGSVAEEAARLLNALLGEAAADRAPHDDPPPHAEPSPYVDPPPHADPPPGSPPEVCGTCGRTGAEPASSVCRLCPVCQLIGAARAINPETVDRLADLAAAVTETLRDLAAHRWAESGRAGHAPAPDHPSTTVEDITVGEGEDDADPGDADRAPGTDDDEAGGR